MSKARKPREYAHRPPGSVPALIRIALTKYGGMTRSKLALEIGDYNGNISTVLTRMHKNKEIYISAYDEHGAPGERVYPRAVYSLGWEEEAKKPKRKTHVQNAKTHREKKRVLAMSSVFGVGARRI